MALHLQCLATILFKTLNFLECAEEEEIPLSQSSASSVSVKEKEVPATTLLSLLVSEQREHSDLSEDDAATRVKKEVRKVVFFLYF